MTKKLDANVDINNTQSLAPVIGVITGISIWIAAFMFGIPNSFLFGLGAGAIVGVVAFANRGLAIAGTVLSVLLGVIALATSGS